MCPTIKSCVLIDELACRYQMIVESPDGMPSFEVVIGNVGVSNNCASPPEAATFVPTSVQNEFVCEFCLCGVGPNQQVSIEVCSYGDPENPECTPYELNAPTGGCPECKREVLETMAAPEFAVEAAAADEPVVPTEDVAPPPVTKKRKQPTMKPTKKAPAKSTKKVAKKPVKKAKVKKPPAKKPAAKKSAKKTSKKSAKKAKAQPTKKSKKPIAKKSKPKKSAKKTKRR